MLAKLSVAVFAALLLAFSVSMLDMNEWSPDFSHRELVLIVTDSMEGDPQDLPIPEIRKDSLILVDTGDVVIDVGDVIGYRTPVMDGAVFHRVVSIDAGTVTVKGDALDISETVRMEDVEGKVIGANHFLGIVILLMQTFAVPLLLLLAGLYILSEIKGTPKKEPRRDIQ